MRLEMKLEDASGTREHKLDLRFGDGHNANRGQAHFLLDDRPGEPESADWAKVSPGVYSILLGERSYEARVTSSPASGCGVTCYEIGVGARRFFVEVRDPRMRRRASSAAAHQGPQEIVAPMPGKIVKVLATEGQEVRSGEGLLVIEAMKMQNELRAPRPGRVERIYVSEGAGVETGFKLLRLA